MGWFSRKVRKEDIKGSEEWFNELFTALRLYSIAMRESAIHGNTYMVMTKNIPGYMSLIEKASETIEISKEMRIRIYESSDSEFSKIIHFCKNNGTPKREVDFFEKTIKDIKDKLKID
jgi:hypothetical protein